MGQKRPQAFLTHFLHFSAQQLLSGSHPAGEQRLYPCKPVAVGHDHRSGQRVACRCDGLQIEPEKQLSLLHMIASLYK